jgi:uncharacterized phage protein gp47/JayE
MPTLIPPPDLDIRDEEQLAAQAIARVTGSLSLALIDTYIAALRTLRDTVAAGALAPPICPELTNANPSSPHTVLLEAIGWLMSQMAYRINQLPVRDQIAFANLFNIQLRDPTPAVTSLQFTLAGGLPQNVTEIIIPQGTQVQAKAPPEGGTPNAFTTDADLVILTPGPTGVVSATCTIAGALLLGPNTLTNLVDPVGFVASVTNLAAVDSGSNQETVDSALQRAVNYQQRAERLVSKTDIETAILEEVMNGQGIVKAFPFVNASDWDSPNAAGYTTIVVGTINGNPVDAGIKNSIAALLDAQAVGSQFFEFQDPIYVTFNVTALLLLQSGITNSQAVINAVTANLVAFYAPKEGNFGRPINRGDIIAIIENTPGVLRVVTATPPSGPLLASPLTDTVVSPWELPQLVTVTLTISS